MIITIDGPAASGKSSTGRLLAEKLGFFYLYSGLLYRAVAYTAINRLGYSLEDLKHYTEAPEGIKQIVPDLQYIYTPTTGDQVYVKNENITAGLKDPYLDQAASLVSTYPSIRKALTDLQRELAQGKDIVVDGRDAGTVVFPQADYQFFLMARVEERARRWVEQQKKRGNQVSLVQAIGELSSRDHRDANRLLAPLTISPNAQIIDNTALSLQEVTERMIGKIK